MTATASGAANRAAERIQRLEIDGVTVYWAPDAPRSVGALQFRSGRADEPFPMMGISHLVEHLALYPIGRRPYATNGFVDHVRTVFHVTGEAHEVGTYLSEVAGHLHDLPLTRLADESRILRTEAMSRTPTIGEHLLWFRYGARGYGSLVISEFGLGTITAESAGGWATARHTTGNAAAWIAGPMPDGLDLKLPAGGRVGTVPRVPVDPFPVPAWAPARLPGIALGIIVPRSSAATMALRILTERLERRLRYDIGKSYEVSLAYLPLDAEVGHGSLFASSLDGEIEEVRRNFLEVVDGYLASGPTREELAEDIDRYERARNDPDAVFGELDRRVFNDLLGHPRDTPAELLEEMQGVTPESARAAAEGALATSILAGPLSDGPGGRWQAYPSWSAAAVIGRRHDAAGRRFPWQKRFEQLIVGDEGVSWIGPEGQALTVRFADCVGVVADPGPVRVLYGGDGFTVRVAAADWQNGLDAVARIDRSMPDGLVVDGSGSA